MIRQKWCACLPRAVIECMAPIAGAVLISIARPGERPASHTWPAANVRHLGADSTAADVIAAAGDARVIIVEARPSPAENMVRQLEQAGYGFRVAPASLYPPRKVLYYSPDEIERRLSA